MIGELIRRYGFWTIDFLKGNKIRSNYKDIVDIMENSNLEKQEKYLNNILDYATNNTSFYADYKNYKSLKDFPVIDKIIVNSNEKRILSYPFIDKKLLEITSSGSTGVRAKILQNKEKRKRVLSELIYFGEQGNFRIGEKNGYLRVWLSRNKKGFFKSFMQNFMMLNLTKFDEESLEKVRQEIKANKNLKCILGYASSLEMLSKYMYELHDKPDMFNIKSIISGSEILLDTTRFYVKEVFGIDVVSRYSNQENGIIAQETSPNHYVINRASYYLEFLKLDSDEDAIEGEIARVVITDLFNKAMPLIRYDTGDIALFKKENNQYVIRTIEGRKEDCVYDTSNNILSSIAIPWYMSGFKNIKQYQFIQDDKNEYRLKITKGKDIYKDEEYLEKLKTVLGNDATIVIEHVDSIPLLKSGKFKRVVCNYKPKVSKA